MGFMLEPQAVAIRIPSLLLTLLINDLSSFIGFLMERGTYFGR